ncbi:hypothetical protein D3C78_1585250 [compost metagenome]
MCRDAWERQLLVAEKLEHGVYLEERVWNDGHGPVPALIRLGLVNIHGQYHRAG